MASQRCIGSASLQAPGQSLPTAVTIVTVTLNAAGLLGGDYEADIHFVSNDPQTPDLALNVLMHVTGAPVITVDWAESDGFPERG